jgi:hypothetical protein
MSKALKWILISLGILVVAVLAFCITMFALRGGGRFAAGDYGLYGRGMMGRAGMFGGMWFGMGSMLLRGLFGLAVLVLAGFGVAHLVNRSHHPVMTPPAAAVCSRCGMPLAAEWKACPHCGAAVQAEVPLAPEKKIKVKASK